jgi:quinolinate synthase
MTTPLTPHQVRIETAHIAPKLSRVMTEAQWLSVAPTIAAINRLKKERNAIILGHNYMTPDIFHGVADIVGDSLALAREAAKTDADVIVMAGVHFMAETAKILNPSKKVLIPDMRAGCSLASSITGADVRRLRAQYPGVPVVTYVNTSADVKAESDICCTSGNAVAVVESLGVDRVLFLPDQYLAENVAQQTKVKIITWKGACEVHERFTVADIETMRAKHPGLAVIAHPECPKEVVDAADFAGSTAAMATFVTQRKPVKVMMVTECSMSDNLAADNPDVEFIRPCNLCPHMKRITLPKILEALQTLSPEVTVPEHLMAPARRAVDRMLAVPAVAPMIKVA